jgi:hypothetical protein
MLLYKPVITALRKAGFAPKREGANSKIIVWLALAAAFVLVTCAAVVFMLRELV